MILMMESALAVRFHSATTKSAASASIIHRPHPRRSFASAHFTPPSNSRRRITSLRSSFRCGIRSGSGAAEQSSEFDPPPSPPPSSSSSYHPSEGIEKASSTVDAEDARPTPAEMARTLIEVNSKATLMFSGVVDDQLLDSIFWPDLPYLTDEHGNIYFEVKDNEDVLRTLTNENSYVQVIVGLDTVEILNELDLEQSDMDFGFEEIMEEASDEDVDDDDDDDSSDDYENDWADVHNDEDGMDSDGTLGDWAKLETMRASHPMYFAKKMSEAASDNTMMDCMDQPSPGLCIQGPLQPAFIEDNSFIRKHRSSRQSLNDDTSTDENDSDDLEEQDINGHDHKSNPTSSSQNGSVWAEEVDKDDNSKTGSSFYKLEMIKIQLISPHGNQIPVETSDFQKAQPDAIAHSAPKIISRLKAGGEKFIHALKSLCWRVKGIEVEEAILIGVDSLGFDLRVCSGKQVQNLRFAFNSKANSEYSAERQLHDLLFPRIHQKVQKRKEAHTKEP